MWGLGIVLFELLTGRQPFLAKSAKRTEQNIVQMKPNFYKLKEKPWNLTSNAKDLLEQLLQKDPLKRISLEEAMQHPWFTEKSKKQ